MTRPNLEIVEESEATVLAAVPIDHKTKLTANSMTHFGRELRRLVKHTGRYIWYWEDEVIKKGHRYGLARGIDRGFFNRYRHKVNTNLHCDAQCGECGNPKMRSYENRREGLQNFIKDLISSGWVVHEDTVYCPHCAKEKGISHD